MQCEVNRAKQSRNKSGERQTRIHGGNMSVRNDILIELYEQQEEKKLWLL